MADSVDYRHLYRAYGLNLRANIRLRLPSAEKAEPDVWVQKTAPEALSSNVLKLTVGNDGEIDYRSTSAKLTIRHGREIAITPALGVPGTRVAEIVVLRGLPSLLVQRGLVPLHASCVAIAGRAAVFAGPAGVGKSTIAAAACDRGWSLLADDVTALDGSVKPTLALPAYPRQRLWPDSLERLARQPADFERVEPTVDKRLLPVDVLFNTDPVALGAIFVLGLGQTTELVRLRPGHAARVLISQAFVVEPLHKHRPALRRHFDACAEIAEHVPVFRLCRTSHWSSLFESLGRAEAAMAHLPPTS